jgi:2'-5' RNA ligase
MKLPDELKRQAMDAINDVNTIKQMASENPSGFLRLFIAIAVPAEVREVIGRAQGRLQRHAPPGAVRWTRMEQFHVTLKFLGDVTTEQVAALEKSVAAVCAGSPALRLSARGVGFFPNERKPRVIWAGVNDDDGQLAALHRKLDEALRWLASAERPETFTGHITLGRFKPGHHAAIPNLVELAAEFRGRDFGDWQAGEVEIVRSELTSDGADHLTMAAFRLAGRGVMRNA